ncbi:hypothetical protein DDE83_003323 [Stemphylium lycopersici]|uniref:Thioredoxin domain-containing protein n=1 Tax=Stemphylium lycopersici TaxID=183478 RepID=A0A364N7Q6_STELY|nr:hypothetical protein DDE83_003323 [Stemphylium lycopersici]
MTVTAACWPRGVFFLPQLPQLPAWRAKAAIRRAQERCGREIDLDARVEPIQASSSLLRAGGSSLTSHTLLQAFTSRALSAVPFFPAPSSPFTRTQPARVRCNGHCNPHAVAPGTSRPPPFSATRPLQPAQYAAQPTVQRLHFQIAPTFSLSRKTRSVAFTRSNVPAATAHPTPKPINIHRRRRSGARSSMWLFGRRRRNAAKLKDGGPAAVTDRKPPVAGHQASATQSSNGPRRGPSQRQRRRRGSSRSTQASMRDVEKTVPEPSLAKDAWPQSSTEDITALPYQYRLQHSPHLRPITQEHTGISYNFHSHSHSSLPPSAKDRGKLQRPQSMRRDPPTDSSLVRRKSSRRRREHDLVREEEIRAMSLPMPQKRPAASSGGMLRRDSKKVKGAMNNRFERPTSNVSLPLAGSVHSSMSGGSENRAFRVSALDMFSPRPTIRVSVGSNYHASDRMSPNTYSEKSTRRERRPISSEDEMASKRTSRIADLADDLDARALRDILERDKKKREKKAKAEQERLQRRLERRAQKQTTNEVRGTPATPSKEGTGMVGLGIERDTPVPMEDVRPSTPPQPQRLELPVTPRTQDNGQLPTPLESPTEEAVVSDARAIRYSRGSASAQMHTRGVSNASILPELISEKIAHDTLVDSAEQMQDPTRSGSLHPVETVDTFATSKPGSFTRRPSSEGRRMGVFASLFRRGKRNSQDQTRPTPSEMSFSNTSRESMSRQPLPAHLVGTGPPTQPIEIQRPSSLPRRTMSKFREDLPEFPVSPPDSRVQSPEVPSTSIIAARRRGHTPSDLRVGSFPGDRSDSPVSPGAPMNVMSQSLASVDSEASWLSGRPPKRASNRSQMRSSLTSSATHRNDDFHASYEELGMADDEYFKRLTPLPDQRGRSPYASDERGRKASSTLMALDTAAESDEEVEPTPVPLPSGEAGQVVQSSVGRQPTIIHRRPRVKSTEGLLTMFTDDTGDRSSRAAELVPASPDQDSPTSPTSDSEPASLQRAKSVDLGKGHVVSRNERKVGSGRGYMSRRTALRPGLVAALPKEEGRTLVGQIGRSGKHVIYHCSPSAALCTVIVLIIAPNAIPKKQREALLHQPSQILAYTLHWTLTALPKNKRIRIAIGNGGQFVPSAETFEIAFPFSSHSYPTYTMFAPSSFRVTRTLLTSARLQTASINPTSTANLYRPLFTQRFFSNTAKMSDKQGVHNLQTKAAFDEAMCDKETLMVLDCFATWCGPCKVIAPQVVKFSDTYDKARFYKLDVDEVPDVAQELGIRAMPTFLLFKGGDKVAEVVGANPKALEAAIQANI